MSRSFVFAACLIAAAAAIVAGALLWAGAAAARPQGRQLEAGEFLGLVDGGRVATARIGKHEIYGKLTARGAQPPREYVVSVPSDDRVQLGMFVQRLKRHGVALSYERPGMSEVWRGTLITSLALLAVSALFAVAVLDCVRREFRDPATKILWGLVIILWVVIGPILYLIAGRPMGKRASPSSTGSPDGTVQ